MMTNNIENQKGKFIMIEKDNTRYEFYTEPLYRSNVDHTIIEYRPAYRCCQKLTLGSTCSFHTFPGLTHEERVERGNKFFKEMLDKGFKVVTKRSFA